MKVLIGRGLPGSGKSSYFKGWKNSVICSADDFHMIDREYRFDPKNIRKAHDACLSKFFNVLTGKQENYPDFLIVDNTNISGWECSVYYRIAELFGHEVKILTFWCSPELSMKRNTHNVPATTILQMYRTLLTEVLPPHWN